MKKQPHFLLEKKSKKIPITMLTAYDAPTAALLEEADIDVCLVGDSIGNVLYGYRNTLPVTIEQIITHTQAVSRGCQTPLLIADMPFLSYQVSASTAIQNAGRLLKEGFAQAVKIEIGSKDTSKIEAVIQAGIPVMGHIGFTPQFLHSLGGYKVQGRTGEAAHAIINMAENLQSIGCFAVLLEMIPQTLAQTITETLQIPTIGIGAGPHCDGQVLVTQDILGLNPTFKPKFSKQYVNLHPHIKSAIQQYKNEVENRQFPDKDHSFD